MSGATQTYPYLSPGPIRMPPGSLEPVEELPGDSDLEDDGSGDSEAESDMLLSNIEEEEEEEEEEERGSLMEKDPVFEKIKETLSKSQQRSESIVSMSSDISDVSDGPHVQISEHYTSVPFGIQPKATYEHSSLQADIMGVAYNGRMRQFVILDAKGITTWKRDLVDPRDMTFLQGKDLTPKTFNLNQVRRALQYPKYEYRLIMHIVYAPKYNCYFALGKDFSVKVLNRDFEETCSVNTDMRSVLYILFNPVKDELITGGVGGIKIWQFLQVAGKAFTELKPLANYELRIKDTLPNVGGSWVKKVELDHHLQHLYCCSDTDLHVYDLTGKLLYHFQRAHTMSITGACFSPSAKVLVTSSVDSEVKVWSLNGGLVHTFRGHSRAVTSLLLHPETSSLLITSSLDGSIRMWSLDVMDLLYMIVVSADGVMWMGLTDDKLLYISTCRNITLWHLNNFYSFWSLARNQVSSLSLASCQDKTTRVLAIGEDSSVRIFCRCNHKNITTVLPPPDISPLQKVLSVCYSREKNAAFLLVNNRQIWVYTTRTDPSSRIAIWDVHDLQLPYISGDASNLPPGVIIQPPAQMVITHRATENGNGNEIISNCCSLCILNSTAMMMTDEGLCCPIRHTYLLLGMEDGRILFMDPVIKGQKYMEFKASKDSIQEMRHDTAHSCLITLCRLKTLVFIQIWGLPQLDAMYEFYCGPDVTCYARVGLSMLTGHTSGQVNLHSLEPADDQGFLKSKQEPPYESIVDENRRPEHQGPIVAMDALASLQIFVTCSYDGGIKVWDENKVLLTEVMLEEPLSAAAFLNEMGDLLVAFKNHIFYIDHSKLCPAFKPPEVEMETSDQESDVYEDPRVLYEMLQEDEEPVTLENYLVPYDHLEFDKDFLEGKTKIEQPKTVAEVMESSESETETDISLAPSSIYLSPAESIESLSMIDLTLGADYSKYDLRDQMKATLDYIGTKGRKRQKKLVIETLQQSDVEDKEIEMELEKYSLPVFGESPGGSPSITPPSGQASPRSRGQFEEPEEYSDEEMKEKKPSGFVPIIQAQVMSSALTDTRPTSSHTLAPVTRVYETFSISAKFTSPSPSTVNTYQVNVQSETQKHEKVDIHEVKEKSPKLKPKIKRVTSGTRRKHAVSITQPKLSTSPSALTNTQSKMSTSPIAVTNTQPKLSTSPSAVTNTQLELSTSPSAVTNTQPKLSTSPSAITNTHPKLSTSPSLFSSTQPKLSTSPSAFNPPIKTTTGYTQYKTIKTDSHSKGPGRKGDNSYKQTEAIEIGQSDEVIKGLRKNNIQIQPHNKHKELLNLGTRDDIPDRNTKGSTKYTLHQVVMEITKQVSESEGQLPPMTLVRKSQVELIQERARSMQLPSKQTKNEEFKVYTMESMKQESESDSESSSATRSRKMSNEFALAMQEFLRSESESDGYVSDITDSKSETGSKLTSVSAQALIEVDESETVLGETETYKGKEQVEVNTGEQSGNEIEANLDVDLGQVTSTDISSTIKLIEQEQPAKLVSMATAGVSDETKQPIDTSESKTHKYEITYEQLIAETLGPHPQQDVLLYRDGKQQAGTPGKVETPSGVSGDDDEESPSKRVKGVKVDVRGLMKKRRITSGRAPSMTRRASTDHAHDDHDHEHGHDDKPRKKEIIKKQPMDDRKIPPRMDRDKLMNLPPNPPSMLTRKRSLSEQCKSLELNLIHKTDGHKGPDLEPNTAFIHFDDGQPDADKLQEEQWAAEAAIRGQTLTLPPQKDKSRARLIDKDDPRLLRNRDKMFKPITDERKGSIGSLASQPGVGSSPTAELEEESLGDEKTAGKKLEHKSTSVDNQDARDARKAEFRQEEEVGVMDLDTSAPETQMQRAKRLGLKNLDSEKVFENEKSEKSNALPKAYVRRSKLNVYIPQAERESVSSARSSRRGTPDSGIDETISTLGGQTPRTPLLKLPGDLEQEDDIDVDQELPVPDMSLLSEEDKAKAIKRPATSFTGLRRGQLEGERLKAERPHTAHVRFKAEDLQTAFEEALRKYQNLPGTPAIVSAETLYRNDGINFEDNWQERVIERHTLLRLQKEIRAQSAAQRRQALEMMQKDKHTSRLFTSRCDSAVGGLTDRDSSIQSVRRANTSMSVPISMGYGVGFAPPPSRDKQRPKTANPALEKQQMVKHELSHEKAFRYRLGKTGQETSRPASSRTISTVADFSPHWIDPRNPDAWRPKSSRSIPSKCNRYVLVNKPKESFSKPVPSPLEEQLLLERFPKMGAKIVPNVPELTPRMKKSYNLEYSPFVYQRFV